MKRVVQHRDVWPRGIQQPQILKTAGAVDVWQKAMEEFQIALAIKYHHRDLLAIGARADAASEILRDDVAQWRSLSGTSLAENDSLHDADSVRPQPRFGDRIVPQDNGVPGPSFFDIP